VRSSEPEGHTYWVGKLAARRNLDAPYFLKAYGHLPREKLKSRLPGGTSGLF